MAERRVGEMLKGMGIKPGHPKANADTLSGLGIQHHQSSRWQKLENRNAKTLFKQLF